MADPRPSRTTPNLGLRVPGDGELAKLVDILGAMLDQIDTAVPGALSGVAAHIGAKTGVHGVAGDVVGTSDTQTLSNKTLAATRLIGATSIAAGASFDGSPAVPAATADGQAVNRAQAASLVSAAQTARDSNAGAQISTVSSILAAQSGFSVPSALAIDVGDGWTSVYLNLTFTTAINVSVGSGDIGNADAVQLKTAFLPAPGNWPVSSGAAGRGLFGYLLPSGIIRLTAAGGSDNIAVGDTGSLVLAYKRKTF